jgi:DNA-binding transcriptional ArsR family regulator
MALGALAQDTRLAIFRLLVQAGRAGLSVGEIGDTLSVAPATLSFHLKTLAQAGLVTTQPRGRFIVCRADYDAMRRLVSYLMDNCCAGGGPAHGADLRVAAEGTMMTERQNVRSVGRGRKE